MDRDQKLKAREKVLQKLNKDHGKNTVSLYSDMPSVSVEKITSGSFGLDVALGGGWARGRIVEVYGSEGSGKTTLTLHAIAEIQKDGGLAAFIDAEHAFDPDYAQNLGVNMADLTFSQPDSGEQAFDIAEELAQSGAYDMIVIDSIAAMTPKAEIEGEMGDHHVGLHARLVNKALRKLSGPISTSKSILVLINQTRSKIGVMFGNPNTTTGGRGIPFFASQRVEVARIGNVKKGDEAIAGRTRCKVVKNKVAIPFKQCEFDITFGIGINKRGEILDEAVRLDMVEKSGSWYKFNGENIGQGRDATLQWFAENPEEFATIEHQVRGFHGLN